VLRYIFWTRTSATFQRISEHLVKSKARDSTRIYLKWKLGIKVTGMKLWWLTIVDAWNVTIRQLATIENQEKERLNMYNEIHVRFYFVFCVYTCAFIFYSFHNYYNNNDNYHNNLIIIIIMYYLKSVFHGKPLKS